MMRLLRPTHLQLNMKVKTLEAPTIKFVASDDNGFYDNTYKSGRNGYETFSNTVTNKTPTAPKTT